MDGMMAFHDLFPEVGFDETRTVTVFEETDDLPKDSYGFVEFYCVDPTCNCRRVMLNVLSEKHSKHLATINHSFEPPPQGDVIDEQTFLDALNPQSTHSMALLHLFESVLLQDSVFTERIERHYHMVKDALRRPKHPIWKVIESVNEELSDEKMRDAIAKVDPYSPCPCGSGKKFKWCCRAKTMASY